MPEAANKLLKSLEEPPAHVHFILVTDRLERVLPTIVSRCQVVEFRPLSDVEVEAYLRDTHGVDGEEGRALARLARGSVERAARLAADARGARLREEYLAHVARLAGPAGGRRTGRSRARRRCSSPCSTGASTPSATRRRRRSRAASPRSRRSSPTRRTAPGTASGPRRSPSASATGARGRRASTPSTSWSRGCATSGRSACGADGAVLNCDHAAELAADAVARPEFYARLLAAAAATRKDLYLNVDQKLALQAMFARFEEVARSA